ncbi:hypothetical protein [Algoriphagus marinus]|uniref:hypothetical protein n=1 Tax=Algoriphagus marinus TaxID=1925762 RepID=UPI000B32782C|nr:hypothetical protein [Algoriphagus marinus]
MFKKISLWWITNLLIVSLLMWPPFSFAQYKLERVDGFIIDSLYPVEIVDYFPQDELYLGYINSSEGTRIALINEKGDFIIQKVLQGDGPNLISSSFNSLAFSKEGGIWIQTPFELVLFDQKFNVKKRTKYLSESKVHLYGRMEVFSYFYQNQSLSSFSFITNPSGLFPYKPNRDINSIQLIEIYQVDKNKLYKIAPVSDRPLHKKFEISLGLAYVPSYVIDKKSNKLYLTSSLDNEITVYDLVSDMVHSRIKINHGDFKILYKNIITKSDFPSYGRISLGPKNHKLFLLDGGKIVLDYIREIPYGTYEKKIADDPTYHHFQDPNYHRLILFDNTKQVSGDIALPANGKLMTSLPGNRLLFQLIDPNLEEDFVRYGIYKVVGISK